MSASIALVRRDRVEIASDAAAYDGTGTVDSFREKIVTVEKPAAAITCRGPVFLTDKLSVVVKNILTRAGNFEKGLRVLADIVPTFARYEEVKARVGNPRTDFQMIIGGVSETDGPLVAFWASRPHDEFELAAYTLHRISTGIVQDAVLPEHFRNEIDAQGGLGTVGVRMMESLRQEPLGFEDEHPFIVGGHVDLATVTATGVETARLHEWAADRAGEKINPEATNLTRLSRAERRRVEKAERKGRAAA